MRSYALLLAAGLAACAQLPEDCNRRALRELRVVDRLVEETRVNLARGYTYEYVETRFRTGFVVCSGDRDFRFCTGTGDDDYRRRPVAIDPAAERRKLESLQERRQALIAATAGCRAG